jgi:hypothetical protein
VELPLSTSEDRSGHRFGGVARKELIKAEKIDIIETPECIEIQLIDCTSVLIHTCVENEHVNPAIKR